MHPLLRRLDLNLLLVFNALLRHQSVSGAADDLAMSPSALSHALSRLRHSLGDELFVRIGNAMLPTTYAETLAEPISVALEVLSNGLSQTAPFEPTSSDRTFVLAATDYTAFTILPNLIAHVQKVAPNVRFKVIYSRRNEAPEDLATGRVDFALGYAEEVVDPTPGIESFDWLKDEYVVIASKNHDEIRGALTLEQYLAARHVVVTPWNDTSGTIEKVLARLGLSREIAVELPSVLAAPFIVAHSSLVMTVPRNAARTLQNSVPISIYPAPFPIPPYTVKVYGHLKHSRTHAHTWLRAQLTSIARAL